MTQKEAIHAFTSGLKVNLKCYYGTFLNREIVALTYQKDLKGKIYVTVDLKGEKSENSTITAKIENCTLAKGEALADGKT